VTADKPVIAVLLQPEWRPLILSPPAEAELAELGTVLDTSGQRIGADNLPTLLAQAAICLTGWDIPPLSEKMVADAPDLRLIAHTAGTVRRLLPRSIYGSRVRVSHATAAMATAVAEHIVAQALLAVQSLHVFDRDMRAGSWPPRWELHRSLLGARTVGIWGLGRVGSAAAQLFRAFGCRVIGTDPTLEASAAARLGVELMLLDELFCQSEIVCVLAPVLEATRGLIDAAMLARLRDGAVFINSGRGVLVDDAALLAELKSGRIGAALDVYTTEPLPAESPLRGLPNVILSPHVGGHTVDTHFRQGQAMVDEARRLLRSEPLQFEVTAENESRLA
jgi:phosphoglycerate dehydrogenase-like enzyme